jgi:membrane fusion protein, multidrug efflux system
MSLGRRDLPLPPTHPHRQPPRKIWSWLLLVVVIALAAGATLVIRHKSGQVALVKGASDLQSRPVPVLAAVAAARDVNVYLEALGTVASRNTVTVKTRIDGELMKINFREGQAVRAGDLLAEVDPRPYEAQLAQMTAQLAKDRATLDNIQMDLDRYTTLLAQDSIARQQVDTQQALLRETRAAVAVDQAQVDNARLQLSYCRITSPLDGVVGLRLVDPGNQIHAADAAGIVTITQMQPITVLFPIPEDSLPTVVGRMKKGGALAVMAFDRQNRAKLAEGALLTLDNQIDPATGTIRLRAEFRNDQNTLFPNQFVNIRMLVDVQKNAIAVPASAVQRGSHGSNVYVLKNDETVEMRAVSTGVTEGENVVITDGLAAGDKVVVDGADKLRDGARVRAVISVAPENVHHHGQSGEGTRHQRSDG